MSQALENLLSEDRTFEPAVEFSANANAKPGIHQEAEADYLAFWPVSQALVVQSRSDTVVEQGQEVC